MTSKKIKRTSVVNPGPDFTLNWDCSEMKAAVNAIKVRTDIEFCSDFLLLIFNCIIEMPMNSGIVHRWQTKETKHFANCNADLC